MYIELSKNFQNFERKRIDNTEVMTEFNKYEELKYISLWVTLIVGVIGVGKSLNVNTSVIIYIAIITIVVTYAYIKTKEVEWYKKKLKEANNGTQK